MLKKNGILYISFPIAKSDAIYFNSERVFHPKSILKNHNIKSKMRLIRFDYVDEMGDLHLNTNLDSISKSLTFGCGIYTFKKIV